MNTCPTCAEENAALARFCSACGGSLESELEQFLRGNGLEQLLQPLKSNDFSSLDELHSLTDADFKELGVSLGLRIKLRAALQQMAASPEAQDEETEEDALEIEGQSDPENSSAQALAYELSRLSRIDRVYLPPTIPPEKLSAACASYVRKPGVEILLLYDVTVFGGAKDGLVIAKDGLYLKESFQSACYFRYDSIVSVQADENIIRVNCKEVLNCMNIPAISVKRIASAIAILSGHV